MNKTWRSKAYTDWIKTLPNVVDFSASDDPHHIKGNGFGGSIKPHDLFTIPMSREHHTELHRIGWQSFENKYQLSQAVEVLRCIDLAIKQGVIKIA